MKMFNSQPRLLLATFALLLAGNFAYAQVTRNIGTLLGRTDSNTNLFVRASAAGATGQSRAIGNLMGRTDANQNLFVTFDSTVPSVFPAISIGTGTATAVIGGVLTTSTLQACTIADTVETTLFTYTLPAGTLATDGRGYRIITSGFFAANANTKTLKIYLGASLIATSASVVAAPNGTKWWASYDILRTGAAAEFGMGVQNVSTQTNTTSLTTAEILANDLVIKVTGLNGTAAANDICFSAAIVRVN